MNYSNFPYLNIINFNNAMKAIESKTIDFTYN